MFCENCGSKVSEESTFCQNCGNKIKSGNASSEVVNVKKDKDMITALILSFILIAIGIAYAGNRKKGIILFVVGLTFAILGLAIPLLSVVAIAIWAYSLYETYNEVKIANGESNPNLIEDIKGFPTPKKIGAIVVIAIIILVVVGGIVGALTPKQTTTTYNDLDDEYDSDIDSVDDSSSDSSDDYSSSSSDGSESYSSSSDGHDVSSHYEGEHGSSDTHGTVYDDGSVESHQTGHTDYGDYKIDSYMDSEGNVHGDVEVGGKTYHVSN